MSYDGEITPLAGSGGERPRLRLIDAVRDRMRVKHYSLRTEQAYLYWIRRYIRACGGRHPRELDGVAVEGFLSSLATRDEVSASTQNQALSALLFLYREVRVDMARVSKGPRGAFGLGVAFAAGWTPCIGPVLATILATAAASGTAAWGGILLVFYSLGLGIPFVLLAVGFSRARGSLAWLRRHGRAVETTGGLAMVAVGVLFVSGAWRTFFLPLQRSFAEWGWPPI